MATIERWVIRYITQDWNNTSNEHKRVCLCENSVGDKIVRIRIGGTCYEFKDFYYNDDLHDLLKDINQKGWY